MSMIGIGIDSGGTHTTCAVKYADDSLKAAITESSSTLSDARSAISMRRAAEWIVSRILDLTQPGDECCVWIGAAAGVMATSTSLFERAFEVPLLKLSGRNVDCEIFIANDAISILKAPPLLGCGIVAIVGTGSIVVGAHPACPDGVIRRGGYEWPVGDHGAGIWMTFESIRLVLEDIQQRGSNGYQSSLLDRLCDYFNLDSATFELVPVSHSALARAEELASTLARAGEDSKRRTAGFVHPNLFDLASVSSSAGHDPVAARVISGSVRIMAAEIAAVSETLAAFTADNPNSRERLQLVVAGSIAANPSYQQLLEAAVSELSYVRPLQVVGDAAQTFADLAMHYLRSNARERRAITKGFDPIHQVQRLQ